MLEIFSNKVSWLAFAQKHNISADSGAKQLSGSQSYTTAAIHLAAKVALPSSILLIQNGQKVFYQ